MSAVKQTTPKPKDPSVSGRLRDFFRNEIKLNGNPKDKIDYDALRKKSWTDETVKLDKNSTGMSDKQLDKIIKELGYVIDNIRPCCWECNKMRGGLDLDYFINKCKIIGARLE